MPLTPIHVGGRSALSMQIFESLDVWDICALVAGSSGQPLANECKATSG